MSETKGLDSSIPANNEKIIELYNKVKSGQLESSPDFQRKLVWKKQHKIHFVNTILMNYPFPEIYKAPGELDVDTLKLKDLIVDGQQRVTTIVSFIDGKDVFALAETKTKFSGLNTTQKTQFLNYEVSIRYLKNASKDQVKEIFQRINNTEYALNRIERLNAQFGDSELVCFAKQIIEKDLGLDLDMVEYKIQSPNREQFLDFFHQNIIFNENDNNRMFSLQFVLALLATLIKGEYFSRNSEVIELIQLYNETFDRASELEAQLIKVIRLIEVLALDRNGYWFNKANIFTLICELYKYDASGINAEVLAKRLKEFETQYKKHMAKDINIDNQDLLRYYDCAREAVNEKASREHRGKVVNAMITAALEP